MNNDDPTLNNTKASLLNDWSVCLDKAMCEFGDIYILSDTETTGVNLIEGTSGRFNRVLEWSMVFCVKIKGEYVQLKDSLGNEIVLDEPLNPFIEKKQTAKQKRSINYIPKQTIDVHGITLDYLFSKEDGLLGRNKLPHLAISFDYLFNVLQRLFNFHNFLQRTSAVVLVFHNASFDLKFLNQETEMYGFSPIESYFSIIDTLTYAKRILIKAEVNKYTLDSIYQWASIKYPAHCTKIKRDVHTSLVDSIILKEVLTCLSLYEIELNGCCNV